LKTRWLSKAAPLHQQSHSWSHWDQLTWQLQQRWPSVKPSLEEHHPYT
jgi:hypothetical protein